MTQDPYTQAIANLNNQNFMIAIDGFNKSIAAGVNVQKSMKMRSQSYFYANKYQSAAASYQEMIKKYPTSQEGYYGKAFSLWMLGQGSQIQTLYQKAIQLNPKNWKVYFCKGYVLLKMRRYDQSIQMLQQAITKNSLNDPLSFICLAEAYCAKKNFANSRKNIKYARKALEDSSNYQILYRFQITKLYQLLNQYQKDIQNLQNLQKDKKIKPETREEVETNLTKQLTSSIVLNNSIIFRQFSQKMSTASTDQKTLVSVTNISNNNSIIQQTTTPLCQCKCNIM